MKRINVFVRRQRIKKLENLTIAAICAEAFLLAISPYAAAAVIVLGFFTYFLRLQIDRKFKLRSLPFDMPVTIFLLMGAVSVFMSLVRDFDLIYNYCGVVGVFFLTYLLVGQNIRKPEHVKILAKSLAISALLVVLYGYFQYIFGIEISEIKWADAEAFPELRRHVFSTFENPNILAGYLDVMICLALGLLAKFGTKKQKLILVAAILMLLACLIMTHSHGAFLTAAIIFVIYGIFYDKRILIFFALIAAILFYNDANIIEEILSGFVASNDSSEILRSGIWVSTISMIADHPFVGIGWGAFESVYPSYNYYLIDATQKIYHAHNLYLQTAAEVGIAGALAYFWYFFGTMFMALDLNSNERYSKMKNTAGEIAERASKSKFKQKFDEEFVKTFVESKFLQRLAQIKSMMILRMSETINQISDKFSKTPETKTKPKTVKKSEPELVHHEEMKWNKKSDKKETDDDKIDIQKFAAEIMSFESEETKSDKKLAAGMKLGTGLAFLSMALNGITDNFLFYIPASIFMWMLGALAAAVSLFDEEN